MSNIEKIKDRIRKLLNMAADSSSPNEAAIAADRAARLMRKHQLDHADVVIEQLDSGTEMDTDRYQKEWKAIPGWVQSLAISVARASEVGVRIVRAENSYTYRTLEFCGYGPDVELANWLMTYLTTQIESLAGSHRRGMAKAVKERSYWDMSDAAQAYYQQPRRYMRSYRDGLGHEIRRKLAEFYAQGNTEVSDTSRALVTAKQNAIRREFGEFNYGTRRTSYNGNGYQAGAADGRHVNVSRAVGGRAPARPNLLT